MGRGPRRQTPRADVHARMHARDSYAIYTVNFVFPNVIYLQNSLTDGIFTIRRRNGGEDVVIPEKLKVI